MKRWLNFPAVLAASAAAVFLAFVVLAGTLTPHHLPTVAMHSPTMVIPGVGSGFYIGNGKIVTAAHVARHLHDGDKKAVDEDGHEYEVVVLWEDEEYDIAVLQVKGAEPPREHIAELSCRMPIVGEKITIEGNPLDFHFVRTDGTVASIVHLGGTFPMWHEWFFGDITALPGNSGGPVYEQHGRVIGVLVGALVKNGVPVHVSIIVPAGVVCRLLGRV